jgi:hypothetical protein
LRRVLVLLVGLGAGLELLFQIITEREEENGTFSFALPG